MGIEGRGRAFRGPPSDMIELLGVFGNWNGVLGRWNSDPVQTGCFWHMEINYDLVMAGK
jgi:hypothetical protein